MIYEQYKKTYSYRHNELVIAFWDFLYKLFSGWYRPCRYALSMRTESIEKAERDYKAYVMNNHSDSVGDSD